MQWGQYQNEARDEYRTLSHDPTFLFGLALYIGEGSKTYQNSLCLANCDPRVIQHGLRFFLKIGVPRTSIRCALHLHPGLDVEAARDFWQETTGLPLSQFYAVMQTVSRASSGKMGNLQPFGTCQLRAASTKICQKLSVWMDMALDGPLV